MKALPWNVPVWGTQPINAQKRAQSHPALVTLGLGACGAWPVPLIQETTPPANL